MGGGILLHTGFRQKSAIKEFWWFSNFQSLESKVQSHSQNGKEGFILTKEALKKGIHLKGG